MEHRGRNETADEGYAIEAVEQTIPLQEKIKKKWITQETMRLGEEQRELKKRRDISEDDERTYRTKSNEVRKAARKDNAKWLEDQCRDIERVKAKQEKCTN